MVWKGMKYDFKETEKKIKKLWEKEKVYKFDSRKKGKIYSVDTPPPTVSGKMHIGHAFSYSQQDFIVRFRRMLAAREGGAVFYPFGTDDNGLPTERLVEKLKNVKSKNMSRTEFIKLCLKTIKEITPDFVQDWKDIGISSDFDVSYSTIDENSRKLSQKSFIELYKKGHVYKDDFPTIWCTDCQTSIAQAELEDREQPSVFSTIKFKAGNGSGENLLIATTRPELLGACVAIFVHPKNKKYKKFIGKTARVPLFDFEVPIIADESADPEKGTGAMMVCSYGDKYDVEAILKHKLASRVIFNRNGTLNIGNYKGMKIKEARKKIIWDLKSMGLITEQKQISHVVNVHDKCGTEIEFIPTEQWFVKILDKKKKWIELGKKINWYPKHMFKRYVNWIEGLEWDWNISRDRHFGVPIPVWYCEKCKNVILPSEKELPIDPVDVKKKCLKCNLVAAPEKKVLDTWATSSLTPQIASSLVNGKVKIPFSLRPQAHDIIRTWAFYTIVKTYLHENKIRWEDIVISGNVSLKGEKMSKSKGNVIDPRKILDEYGADALRFWAAGSKLGEDLDYQEKDLVTGKKFVNKLLNASNFVFMNLEGYNGKKKPKKIFETDQLFLKELNRVIFGSTNWFERYSYSQAKLEVERFFWNDFADNYLEIVKKRIYKGSGDDKLSAKYTLYQSLLAIVKMIAPIMPFVAEEVYQQHFRKFEKEKSIHVCAWPEYDSKVMEEWNKIGFHNEWFLLISIISNIRQEKTKAKKSLNSEIVLTIKKDLKEVFSREMMQDLKNVTNAREIKEGK
ncbi:MAG: valine--tRNA ligase, partial [Thermoplasmata archaeon M8B2D]